MIFDLGFAVWRYLESGRSAIGAHLSTRLTCFATFPTSHASLDDGQRTIDLTAATDTPIRRHEYDFFGDAEKVYDEALDMSPGAVRLERLNKGAPLLDSHNYYDGTRAMIGAVVPGSARVSAGKLIARAKFSRSEAGERAFQDAKDGILRSVSIGYLIHKLEIDDTVDPPMHRITDWEPHEISAVAIPADRNAGFRSAQIARAAEVRI
jgi:prohead serine protease